MRIANGVEMLEISATIMGKLDIIHPTLIWDKNTMILVDTGYPGQLPLLYKAMENVGMTTKQLRKILITHQDLDHIGSLPDILKKSIQKIEVLANEDEKPYIQGEKRLLRLSPEAIQQTLDSIPDDVPIKWKQAFKSVLENPPKAQVDRIVKDGEELPDCGGMIIINTPGHTPGHISVYHKQSKTLIAGDALVVEDGRLVGPTPQLALNMDLAIKSLKKLTYYDIETVICYHGGLYTGDVNKRIEELSKGYNMFRHN